MTIPRDHVTLTLPRSFLEHAGAVHLKRMRMALWLYLTLLGRLPSGNDVIEIAPAALAGSMGLPEGTVRSWLGHLRKGRYVAVLRRNGSVLVTIRRPAMPSPGVSTDSSRDDARPPARRFTVPKLARALGHRGDTAVLERALSTHAHAIVQKALAGALAVPEEQIRRSRTALFLYLLKRHETN